MFHPQPAIYQAFGLIRSTPFAQAEYSIRQVSAQPSPQADILSASRNMRQTACSAVPTDPSATAASVTRFHPLPFGLLSVRFDCEAMRSASAIRPAQNEDSRILLIKRLPEQFTKTIYRTTIAVLLASPSPALLTAMMQYSSSFPLGCSTNVASEITAVATSSHAPAGRSLRVTL